MQDSAHPTWNRGDVIVERHVKDGSVLVGLPLRVWSDDGHSTVTYLSVDTAYEGMVGMDGKPTREFGVPRKRVPRTWQDNHVLRLFRSGDEYGVHVYFDDRWHMRGYYVNFQEPVRRYAHGLETLDLILDLLIAPDLRAHRWKDEDEFDERIAAGVYEASDLERLREVGRGVLQDAADRKWPFDHSWEGWRPPSNWMLPVLPDGWDK